MAPQELLESSFDVDSDTLLKLAIKQIESITIQRQSTSKFPLILTHFSSILNNITARSKRTFVGLARGKIAWGCPSPRQVGMIYNQGDDAKEGIDK
jgi:hypothetical protein